MADITFDRPVKGKLVVALDNGESWEAADADFEKFNLADKGKLYMRAHDMLAEALGIDDFDDATEEANSVRYLIECAIAYDHSPWAREDGTPWNGEDQERGNEIKQQIRQALGHG